MSTFGAEETIQERRQRLSALPRACEGCEVRKEIMCDRESPCSNYVAAGIVGRKVLSCHIMRQTSWPLLKVSNEVEDVYGLIHTSDAMETLL